MPNSLSMQDPRAASRHHRTSPHNTYNLAIRGWPEVYDDCDHTSKRPHSFVGLHNTIDNASSLGHLHEVLLCSSARAGTEGSRLRSPNLSIQRRYSFILYTDKPFPKHASTSLVCVSSSRGCLFPIGAFLSSSRCSSSRCRFRRTLDSAGWDGDRIFVDGIDYKVGCWRCVFCHVG
jgi:hypothetical protein